MGSPGAAKVKRSNRSVLVALDQAHRTRLAARTAAVDCPMLPRQDAWWMQHIHGGCNTSATQPPRGLGTRAAPSQGTSSLGETLLGRYDPARGRGQRQRAAAGIPQQCERWARLVVVFIGRVLRNTTACDVPHIRHLMRRFFADILRIHELGSVAHVRHRPPQRQDMKTARQRREKHERHVSGAWSE